MRVGLVICGELETTSGGFLYDRELVRALRKAGDHVEVIRLPRETYGRSLLRGLDRSTRESLRTWHGDLLLQDELAHPALAPINGTLRRSCSCPIVSIVHHLRFSEDPRGPARTLVHIAERAYLRSVDAFVFNGESTRNAVERLGGRAVPCIVAPPGGDRLGYGLGEEESVARAARGERLRVLFVGNLIPRKDALGLLTALSGIERRRWHLTIVGSTERDPSYAERVCRAVSRLGLRSQVDILGHVADASLPGLLSDHHVLAVPSAHEGFGIVYLEAMGFGVVPIGSAEGGASEVIRHGETGFLVAPGRTAELRAVLSRLAGDRALLASMARAARRDAGRFPGWSYRMAQVRTWLRGIARDGRAHG